MKPRILDLFSGAGRCSAIRPGRACLICHSVDPRGHGSGCPFAALDTEQTSGDTPFGMPPLEEIEKPLLRRREQP